MNYVPEEGPMTHEHYVSALGKWPIHPRSQCSGHCPFHNPSNHPMRGWPMLIRETALVERVCPHLLGHPDPDSVEWMNQERGQGTWGTHGCDLCCVKAGQEEPILVIGPKHEVSFVLKETKFAQGGLMRCCIDSLAHFIDTNADDLAGVGTIVYCKHETNDPTSMILGQDGVWRWNH